jgi:hypothetical protein
MLETSQHPRFIENSTNLNNKKQSQTYHPNHHQILKDNNCRKLSIDSKSAIYKTQASRLSIGGEQERRVGIGVHSSASLGSATSGRLSSSLSSSGSSTTANCKVRGKIEKSVSFIDQNTNRMAGTMKQGKFESFFFKL